MPRTVTAELLDSLDPSHKDAVASRRDLRIINRLMHNPRWYRKRFASVEPTSAIVEIGAGDGTLAKDLIRHYALNNYTAIDRTPQPADWPSTAVWQQENIFASGVFDSRKILIANLILHHFEDDALARLGERIRNSPIRHIFAVEPCRRQMHKLQLMAGRLIGFNHVTLYDGSVSIDAGFRKSELPVRLGLTPANWDVCIQETFMGSYRMRASRK